MSMFNPSWDPKVRRDFFDFETQITPILATTTPYQSYHVFLEHLVLRLLRVRSLKSAQWLPRSKDLLLLNTRKVPKVRWDIV